MGGNNVTVCCVRQKREGNTGIKKYNSLATERKSERERERESERDYDLFAVFFIPESPSWLVHQGKK